MCWIMCKVKSSCLTQSRKSRVENYLKMTLLLRKCNLPVFLTLTSHPVNEDNVDWLTCPHSSKWAITMLQDFFKK